MRELNYKEIAEANDRSSYHWPPMEHSSLTFVLLVSSGLSGASVLCPVAECGYMLMKIRAGLQEVGRETPGEILHESEYCALRPEALRDRPRKNNSNDEYNSF